MLIKRFFNFISQALAFEPPQSKTAEIHLKDVKIAKSFEPVRSERAEHIYSRLSQNPLKTVHDDVETAGKKSLAWVLWAFKKAADAEYQDGISVHDVSALVYQAAKVELYPINVSRVVHKHTNYIQQVSQDKKTKRYLLTDAGLKELAKLGLVDKHSSNS